MTQEQYELILQCIHYGALAKEQELINSLNKIINNSNAYLDIMAKREAANKKISESKKNKIVKGD